MLNKGEILKVCNVNNLVVYVRGGPSCQELYIYDECHEREASKIYFKDKILDFKLTGNW